MLGRLESLGEEHRDTLETTESLAWLIGNGFARYDEAVMLMERVRFGQVRTLGPRHKAPPPSGWC